MAGPRHGRRWLIIGIVVVVVLLVGAPFVYIHFIEGPAPAKLSLPSNSGGPSSSNGTAAGSTSNAALDGTWSVGTGSIVGYRVQETLIGQQSTAVGRTKTISGSITIAGGSVTKGSFTVDMATVQSDQSERNAQFDGRIMDVSKYPTSTLVLTSPIELARSLPTGRRRSSRRPVNSRCTGSRNRSTSTSRPSAAAPPSTSSPTSPSFLPTGTSRTRASGVSSPRRARARWRSSSISPRGRGTPRPARRVRRRAPRGAADRSPYPRRPFLPSVFRAERAHDPHPARSPVPIPGREPGPGLRRSPVCRHPYHWSVEPSLGTIVLAMALPETVR